MSARPGRLSARRRLLLAVVAAVVAVGPSIALAPSAQAFPGDCKGDAAFSTPDDGLAGTLDPGPANPTDGDPFDGKNTTSIYMVYGYGGLDWTDYDPGCTNVSAGAGQLLAGTSFTLLKGAVATTVTLNRWAYDPATLSILDPISQVAAQAFGNSIFVPLVGLSICAVAVFVAWRYAPKGAIAGTATVAGWIVLLTCLALVTITYPTTVAPKVDAVVTGAVGAVNTAVAGGGATTTAPTIADGLGSNLDSSILYSTWLSGTFGRSNGPTAAKYGPQLFQASTITRAEYAKVKDDPAALNKLEDDKAGQWKDIADQVKDADPDAYRHLAGDENGDRLAATLLGWVAWGCAGFFATAGGLMVLFALLVVRGVLAIVPLLALVAMWPQFRHLFWKVAGYTGGAIVNAVVFGWVTAVLISAYGALLSPSVPWPMALVLMAILTAVAWKGTKGLRSKKNLVDDARRKFGGGRDRNTSDPDGITAPEPEPGAPLGPRQPAPYTQVYPRPVAESVSPARAAIGGALTGAASTAVVGALTGGTVTAAAIGIGAAKGAASGALLSSGTTAGALGAMAVQAIPTSPARPTIAEAPAAAEAPEIPAAASDTAVASSGAQALTAVPEPVQPMTRREARAAQDATTASSAPEAPQSPQAPRATPGNGPRLYSPEEAIPTRQNDQGVWEPFIPDTDAAATGADTPGATR